MFRINYEDEEKKAQKPRRRLVWTQGSGNMSLAKKGKNMYQNMMGYVLRGS